MSAHERLNVGIVGAVGRGRAFRDGLEANGARVRAVCDIRADKLEEAMHTLGASEKYTDYAEMLERSDLDAVVVGTPMHLHTPQSVMALERGLHVLSEVPAGVSIEECRALVQACRRSQGIYMMAENYTYMRPNVLVRELARRGLFGTVYYAEGEYLHELKALNEITRWRRKWQTGIDGITYGTHSLGPILQWMPGDRVDRACCEGSGRHYRDPRGDEYCQDTCVMLCKTAKGALIKIRVDIVSDRPHAMTNYQLQGTDGAYESGRGGPVDKGKIWLRELSEEIRWHDVESLMATKSLAEKYVPEIWLNPPPQALKAGHGGGDFFEVFDFVNAIRGKAPCPTGIHEAMDMTLPGLISQQSVAQGGVWLKVPDSREWPATAPRPQLQMQWPERLLDSPPVPRLPAGYELREFTEADEAGHLELMAKAGFEGWNHDTIQRRMKAALPGGFLVIVHRASGNIVATAMATHSPRKFHLFGGELAYVAGDPTHRGKRLGLAVCAAATARLIRAGYTNIYLLTDDHRFPALKTYLRLGYEPFLYARGMAERWKKIYRELRLEPPTGGFQDFRDVETDAK